MMTSSDFFGKEGPVVERVEPSDGAILSDPISKVEIGEAPEGFKRIDTWVLPNAPKGECNAGVSFPNKKGELVSTNVKLKDGEVQGLKENWIPYLQKAGFILKSDLIPDEKKEDTGPWKLRHPEFSSLEKEFVYKVGKKELTLIQGVVEVETKTVKNALIKQGFEDISGDK